MMSRARRSWRRFRESEPGQRFGDHYRRRQKDSGRYKLRKTMYVGAGIALILAGLFMVIAPGPGWATVFLGLGMIAGESLMIARFMDWAEVGSRRLARPALGAWKRSPAWAKVAVVLATLTCAGVLGYGVYQLFFGSGW